MKHTLLATTALVALTAGTASAELTISASARIGLLTTEGSAVGAVTAAVPAALSALEMQTADYLDGVYGGNAGSAWGASSTAISAGVVTSSSAVSELQTLIASHKAAALLDTSAVGSDAEAQIVTDLATLDLLLAKAKGAAEVAGAVAVKDKTTAVNRMRVSFTGAGETDSGIAFGATVRADNSATGASSGGMAGSQYVSGAFGKITMGDLGGADKDATGNIAGVGLTGLSDHNEVSYQGAAGHNLGYSFSTSGLTFGYSQDTSVTTGSNSAMGVKYSGDMGGTTITVGVGQSKVGTSTQSTMSAAVSLSGLTVKAITSTNDNGPVTAEVVERKQSGTTATTSYVAAVAEKANADTDTTGVSVSYSMDAMSISAFTKTVSTSGSADMDYSGFGFSYDMGGVSLKAGVVDANDTQLVDFGLSFSF